MFYRRKILLALIQIFGSQIEKIRLQKLLFLMNQFPKRDKPEFYFVPYKYGCFSFQANADLKTLTKYGQVSELTDEKCKSFWQLNDMTLYIAQLKEKDKQALRTLKLLYSEKSTDELIKLTYTRYPYYAINSVIADKHLSDEELLNISNARPLSDKRTLFTIGYEGISLEEYLNVLIKHNVNILCDVRRNALSMKYGFSKSQLEKACNGTGITYMHFPELGIDSEQRKELNSQSDYDLLFAKYCKENIPSTVKSQKLILELIRKYKRVAITCFESNIKQCHRTHLAEAITKLEGWQYELMHL